MAKYKKKKSSEITEGDQAPAKMATHVKTVDSTLKQPDQSDVNLDAVDSGDPKRPRKIASGSLNLQFAGDLVLVKNTVKPQSGLFKRYADLFEALANMDKDNRNLIYRFMTGLMLTSHAKKTQQVELKRKLFSLKNDLFVAMANERSLRRIFEFKYLVSKNFRVLSYCENCVQKNTAEIADRHKWKYCKSCQVDHNFYNLLSMEVKFPHGWARLFLSNDQIPKLKGFRLPRKILSGNLSEEAMFDRYHYNSRNLDAFDFDSVSKLYDRLLLQPLAIGAPPATMAPSFGAVRKAPKVPVVKPT